MCCFLRRRSLQLGLQGTDTRSLERDHRSNPNVSLLSGVNEKNNKYRRNVEAGLIGTIGSGEGDGSVWYAAPVSTDFDLEARCIVFSSPGRLSLPEIDQLDCSESLVRVKGIRSK